MVPVCCVMIRTVLGKPKIKWSGTPINTKYGNLFRSKRKCGQRHWIKSVFFPKIYETFFSISSVFLLFLLLGFLPVATSWQTEFSTVKFKAFSDDPHAYHRARRECDKHLRISNHYLYQRDLEPSNPEQVNLDDKHLERTKREGDDAIFTEVEDPSQYADLEDTVTPGTVIIPWYPCENGVTYEDVGPWWSSNKTNFDGGIKIFCNTYEDIYIYTSGFVTFGKRYESPDFTQLPIDEKIVAPFYALQDARCPICRIHFHHYKCSDQDVAEAACSRAEMDIQDYAKTNQFVPTDVVVVCWENIHKAPWQHYWGGTCGNPGEMGNTYQLVLITNGEKTYALFNYKEGEIHGAVFGPFIRMGYRFGREKWEPYFSGTENMHYIDQIRGNTGNKGSWLMPLFDDTEECEDSLNLCTQWLSNTICACPAVEYLPPCPCNELQALLDPAFQQTNSTATGNPCYKSRFKISLRMQVSFYGLHYIWADVDFYQTCCYEAGPAFMIDTNVTGIMPNGPLITSAGGGRLPGTVEVEGLPQSDQEGFQHCCVDSYELCDAFYTMRPVDTCEGYQPSEQGLAVGDPHFMTFDRRGYTFNGVGEYIMAKTTDDQFQLQVRTARAWNETGEETDATVFVAFAAQVNGSTTFQLQLNSQRTAFEMIVDGVSRSEFLSWGETENDYGEGKLVVQTFGPTDVTASFQIPGRVEGWILMASLGRRLMTFNVTVPRSAANKTQGLLGNFNGNPDDDLQARDGTTLPPTATDKELFFQFGTTWSVKKGESLFTYPPGKAYSHFQDPNFVPRFDPCEKVSAQMMKTIREVCGDKKGCIFDFCATGDNETAIQTRLLEEHFLTVEEETANRPPAISVPVSVNATLGQTVTFLVTVTDTEGDDVRVSLVEGVPGAAITPDRIFTWTPESLNPVTVSFIAVDNKGAYSKEATVKVILCKPCGTNGQCDFSQFHHPNNATSFAVAECVCNRGWQGEMCDEDTDACIQDPCPEPGATCRDLTPREEERLGRGFNCSCPEGYLLLEGQCVDMDECAEYHAICEQQCVNTFGTFHCQCRKGYRLKADGKSCQDIDECKEESASCSQVCINLPGSFSCGCYHGYTRTDDGTCLPDTRARCFPPCEQICLMVNGTSYCECKSGYLLEGTKCFDVNECETGQHKCSHKCENQDGGYECSCPVGWQLGTDQRTCQPCDDLHWGEKCGQECNCGQHGVSCDHVSGCKCEGFWDGDYCKDRSCEKVKGSSESDLVLFFQLDTNYLMEYKGFDFPEARTVVNYFYRKLDAAYRGLHDYAGTEILCLLEGEANVDGNRTLLYHMVSFSKTLISTEIAQAALVLYHSLSQTNFKVHIGEATVAIFPDSLHLFISSEEIVQITDSACFFHEAVDLCPDQMTCFDIGGEPVCGDVESHSDMVEGAIWAAISVFGLLVLLLVVIVCVVKRHKADKERLELLTSNEHFPGQRLHRLDTMHCGDKDWRQYEGRGSGGLSRWAQKFRRLILKQQDISDYKRTRCNTATLEPGAALSQLFGMASDKDYFDGRPFAFVDD